MKKYKFLAIGLTILMAFSLSGCVFTGSTDKTADFMYSTAYSSTRFVVENHYDKDITNLNYIKGENEYTYSLILKNVINGKSVYNTNDLSFAVDVIAPADTKLIDDIVNVARYLFEYNDTNYSDKLKKTIIQAIKSPNQKIVFKVDDSKYENLQAYVINKDNVLTIHLYLKSL